MLEAASHKLAAVLPLTRIVCVMGSKMNKTCWGNKDKLKSNVLLWTSTHGHTSVGWPAKSYIHQLCTDTVCCIEDLRRVMANRDRLWEKVKEICADGTFDDENDNAAYISIEVQAYVYKYAYIYHHVMLLAWISLTLSRHFSLSFMASSRSSGLHPVSSHSCSMYICSSWMSCFCSAICGVP